MGAGSDRDPAGGPDPCVRHDGPRRPRTEGRDRPTFVAGRLAGLIPIGQREAARPEVRAQLRPVDLPPAGHQDEYVVTLAATDDDRPEELLEADALEPGALFGARRSLGPDQVEGEPRSGRRPGRRRADRFPCTRTVPGRLPVVTSRSLGTSSGPRE